jgi:hypothetical protein
MRGSQRGLNVAAFFVEFAGLHKSGRAGKVSEWRGRSKIVRFLEYSECSAGICSRGNGRDMRYRSGPIADVQF